MRSRKIVLDTNLWISFLISKRLKEIDNLVKRGEIVLVFSNESIEEFLTVAKRPKFNKYFSDSDLSKLILLFDKYGIIVKVKSRLNDCRDKKDNFLLNLAVDGEAEFLITGDSDLLILKNINKTTICTWKEFLERIF